MQTDDDLTGAHILVVDDEESNVMLLKKLLRRAGFTNVQGVTDSRLAASIAVDSAPDLILLDQCMLLAKASSLHDVGKIGIPDGILLKPGRLTDYEIATMRLHTTIGAEILGRSTFPLLEIAATIALTHHERWDGSGYPRGLEGEDIPLCGHIVAIADVFDVLTHERPYKKAWTRDDALAEIVSHAGTLFDPAGVAALQQVISNDTLADFDTVNRAPPPFEEALL